LNSVGELDVYWALGKLLAVETNARHRRSKAEARVREGRAKAQQQKAGARVRGGCQDSIKKRQKPG